MATSSIKKETVRKIKKTINSSEALAELTWLSQNLNRILGMKSFEWLLEEA